MNIKQFVDKVSLAESRKTKDLVIPMTEARLLRDDLTKLLVDYYTLTENKPEEVIYVTLDGGTFK